jgi:hypothetical protein
MTPRPTHDLGGLSATNTVPEGNSCIFKNGQPAIQAAGNGFNTVADPTQNDQFHFLITLTAAWNITMAQWAALRDQIKENNQNTWPAPSSALYNISAKYNLGPDGVTKDTIEKIKKVDRDEVRLLWHVSYWDGPLTGLALYAGQKCWFQVVDPEAETRVAVLRSLTKDQLAGEEEDHRLFQEHVGMNTDYDSSGNREVGHLRPVETRQVYYSAATGAEASRQSYGANPIIGWFEL